MAEKVVLTYLDGRGKMESIRWLLTVAGVEFEEVHVRKREQYLKLIDDGLLMFQQIPLVQMDGLNLVQTKAILHYIADKHDLHGSDAKQRVQVDMFAEGVLDLMEMIMMLPFSANPKPKLENIQSKAQERYLPVFEKALAGQAFLVGDRLTYADVLLLELSLMLEEKFPQILDTFLNVKAFQARLKQLPAVEAFLKPGSQRKPQPDQEYVKTVMEVFALDKLPL